MSGMQNDDFVRDLFFADSPISMSLHFQWLRKKLHKICKLKFSLILKGLKLT